MCGFCHGRGHGALRGHDRRRRDGPACTQWQRCRGAEKSRAPLPTWQRVTTANKFPRPPGQGASLIERLATGISGSQTGGQGVLDVSLSELVTQGGSFGNWPLNLPPAGSQTFVTLNVPHF